MNKNSEHPTIKVKPHDYQPSKAEMEEETSIDATPEDVIRAAFRQVKVVENSDA